MEKLSKKEIAQVKDVLTDFIHKTAGVEDADTLHKEALNIMGEAFKHKPALIKQAASAYNSNKSIFKLSSAETANTDFGILSATKLYDDLVHKTSTDTIEKAASADFVVKFTTDSKPVTMQKVASASITKDIPEAKMSAVEFRLYMNDVIKDTEKALNKLAVRKDICTYEKNEAIDSFCRNFKVLPKQTKEKVAKHLIDTYREEGQKLLDIYNDTANCFDKVASFRPSKGYKNFPKGDIYTKAEEAICAMYVEKQASDLIQDSCTGYFNDLKCIPGLYRMYKHADGLAVTALGNAIAEPLADIINPDKPSIEGTYDDIISRKLLNELREIEVRNVLVDMYSEPFIASYPSEDIERATITAMQMLPVKERKHPRRHTSLIKTWVSEILGRGTNLSASDADKILEGQKAYTADKRALDPTNLREELY